MEEIIDKIVHWLRDQVEEAKVNGLLVGVSGGLDSAVVAHLIKRAVPDQSLGAIMPLDSSPDSVKHAEKVIESCGIDRITIDLAETHSVMYGQIREQLKQKNEWNEKNDQLANANLRARLRMSTSYALATNYNYLVVGTDNASEWYTGYFTKYGDGGVDILPIIEFTKEEVREMARVLGVPDEVINKKPSADLWEGQTDEAEMGTSYDKIDAFLKGKEIPEHDKRIIENMHKRTEHKRKGAKQFRLS
ncbi:NAD(+) synthase [Virgibacillus phasianinus]|uniref:NH(3)-dependent NAD(+) synthetase n=1 Tax=Virgibacillus phasianinus TaxID=2017483 RepID=A0A220U4N6_9BACI|nr:NAD(+) synthase [Virgibacillus phasianinus]ASK63077.1 NAD(+) synthase [Virgibacillus phasianinus]